MRASDLLRVRKCWIFPLALSAVFVGLMSAIYIGSVINPTGHLHGLPVMLVDEDRGAVVDGRHIDIGASLAGALERSPKVAGPLGIRRATLAQAHATMDRAGAYTTLVIPRTLTRSVLLATGMPEHGGSPAPPSVSAVDLEENLRLGSLGVSLAAGVLAPAVAQISRHIGSELSSLATPAARANPIMAGRLADPVALTTSTYRPLPDHSALGLSAFYVALLSLLSGFIAATLVNSSIDAALGYATTEIGPRWKQRRPVAISRRQTFLAKWAVAAVAAPLLSAVLLLVAVGLLNMYAPNVLLLWLLFALASLMIATGTLALLAAFGAVGQLLAMLLFIYLSLASSGGTIPIQALPGVFNVVGHVEPLRQLIAGTRAILYFDARGDAGLTHALIVLAAEFLFWAALGLVVTTWYDSRKLDRIPANVLSEVDQAIDQRAAATKRSTPASQ